MIAQKTETKYWVKYNLHKDGSPVEDGFYEVEDAEKHILKLKRQGYNPIRKYNSKESR